MPDSDYSKQRALYVFLVALVFVVAFCLKAIQQCLGDFLDWLTVAKDDFQDGFDTEIDDAESGKKKGRGWRDGAGDPGEMLYSITIGPVWSYLGQKMSESTEIKDGELLPMKDSSRRLQNWSGISQKGEHRLPFSIPNLEICFPCQIFISAIGSYFSAHTEVGESDVSFKDNKGKHHMEHDAADRCCDPCGACRQGVSQWMAQHTQLVNKYERSSSASELIRNPVSDDSEHEHVYKTPDEI